MLAFRSFGKPIPYPFPIGPTLGQPHLALVFVNSHNRHFQLIVNCRQLIRRGELGNRHNALVLAADIYRYPLAVDASNYALDYVANFDLDRHGLLQCILKRRMLICLVISIT